MALWLTSLGNLNGVRRTKVRALRDLSDTGGPSLASHQVDIFILEPETNRYLGRLCDFSRCPKGKRECLVPDCGATAFLQQHANFRWRTDALAEDRAIRLFDRAQGIVQRAADLLLPCDTADET